MAQLALAWVLRQAERRLGDRRREPSRAGARQRVGVGHRLSADTLAAIDDALADVVVR